VKRTPIEPAVPAAETVAGREQDDVPVPSEPPIESTSTTPTPAKKTAPRQPAASKAGAPRARVAASVAKSPSEVVEHAAPKATLDADQIPPVPPLPLVPPVPPLPTDVAVVDGSSVAPHADSSETRHTAAHDADASVDGPGHTASDGEQGSTVGTADDADESSPVLDREGVQPARSLDELPPLPEISAEEAALQFETRPDAAEQATGLESHEPMKFVWSKRWPFLSLVPATSAAEVLSSPSAVSDDTRDAESDDLTELLDLSADSDELAADRDEGEPLEFPVDDARVDGTPVQTTATAVVDDPAPVPAVNDEADASVLDAPVAPEDGSTVTEATRVDAIEPENATTAYPVVTDSATEVLSTDPATEVLTTDSGTEVLSSDPATEVFAARLATGVLPDEPDTEILLDGSVTDAGSDESVATTAEPLPASAADDDPSPVVLSIRNLSRSFGDTVAVDGIDLEVREGSFYGIVGPNGAGKTTTLSMITGLLRPDSGTITVHGIDVWENPDKAKRSIGVLPDRLRLFDRLTGAQLLYYSGVLRGLDGATVRSRVKDLAVAFGLEDALNRLVTDYSAGMTKKVALASAMIHSPRLLVLDEPFESVDPVSAANVIEILQKYVAHGGTVVLSSHGMDLIQRVCDHVAIVVNGQVLAAGAVDDVRGHGTLEDRFVELAGGRKAAEGMEWLHSFSD
jgi:ABC-2 type transport system ATP-binding protein